MFASKPGHSKKKGYGLETHGFWRKGRAAIFVPMPIMMESSIPLTGPDFLSQTLRFWVDEARTAEILAAPALPICKTGMPLRVIIMCPILPMV